MHVFLWCKLTEEGDASVTIHIHEEPSNGRLEEQQSMVGVTDESCYKCNSESSRWPVSGCGCRCPHACRFCRVLQFGYDTELCSPEQVSKSVAS